MKSRKKNISKVRKKAGSQQPNPKFIMRDTSVQVYENHSYNVIGVKGGTINPIVRNEKFIMRIHNLPAYQDDMTAISSKENLPSLHFSRADYKEAWKSAVENFVSQENKSK